MNLQDFIPQAPSVLFNNVQLDSRKVREGSMFIALPGQKTDGARFAQDAIAKGAVAVLCEDDSSLQGLSVPVVEVEDIFLTMSKLMDDIYQHPAESLFCYGVTGTDGKTTVAQMIFQMLSPLEKSSYMGTIGVETAEGLHEVGATTPLATTLYTELASLRDQQIHSLALEISSHALTQRRAEFVKLDVGIITNVVSEHLDFHKTLENYVAAKRSLIDLVKSDGIMLLNADDKNFEAFRDYALSTDKKVATYALEADADFRAVNIDMKATGISFDVVYQGQSQRVEIGMVGLFNVYNSLAAIGSTVLAGHNLAEMANNLGDINGIYGRNVFVNEGQPFKVLLDFAHTPNAIKLLLTYLRETCDKEGRKLTIVTGATGDRDPGKRKPIGELATSLGDQVIFTDEDPGTEDPKEIMKAVLSGVVKDNYIVIHDRKKAVAHALDSIAKDDMVVMLAKAGMTYDMVGEEKVPYNEIEFVTQYLKERY